ncbi:hypothetical protein FBQ95_14325, partial [Chloroflexi bacterium CFX3]|nr:hypothetical protein [Chloroflexi bacterium CFX3]
MWQFFAVWTASLVRTLRLKELVLAVDETKIGNQFGVLLSAVKGGLPKDGQAITFHDQVRQPLDCYAMSGLVFKKRGRLPAHVRVVWGERWLPTPPTEAVGRMPSRCGLRRLSATCLTCPDCMARLWVLLVAAYAWLLVWGMTLATGGKTIP